MTGYFHSIRKLVQGNLFIPQRVLHGKLWSEKRKMQLHDHIVHKKTCIFGGNQGNVKDKKNTI